MRILVYGLNFTPELTGTGKYTGEMAAWLAERGHEIRVVTAPPYYPEWRIKQGYSGWRYERKDNALLSSPDTSDGAGSVHPHSRLSAQEDCKLRVYRCPLWVPKRPRTVTRLLHLSSFMLSSLPMMLGQIAWRPQVVLVVAPTILCAPAGWFVARLAGAAAWLHVQDFELDVAQDLGQFRVGPGKKLASAIERFWLGRFDRVSTISMRMLDRLAAKGIDTDHRALFPNWVDTNAIRPVDGPNSFRRELDLPDEALVALYAGNMGEKQGLDLLVEAARLLKDRSDIVFVLAGAGAARTQLEQEAAGLPNIKWLPLQPDERFNELLNLADIHLLPQRADAADRVMPSKLTGMLASGRPVIATAAPATQVAEVVTQCGYVATPGSGKELVEALTALAEDAPARQTMGQAARRYACEHLAKDVVLETFYAELCATVDRTRVQEGV